MYVCMYVCMYVSKLVSHPISIASRKIVEPDAFAAKP